MRLRSKTLASSLNYHFTLGGPHFHIPFLIFFFLISNLSKCIIRKLIGLDIIKYPTQLAGQRKNIVQAIKHQVYVIIASPHSYTKN